MAKIIYEYEMMFKIHKKNKDDESLYYYFAIPDESLSEDLSEFEMIKNITKRSEVKLEKKIDNQFAKIQTSNKIMNDEIQKKFKQVFEVMELLNNRK